MEQCRATNRIIFNTKIVRILSAFQCQTTTSETEYKNCQIKKENLFKVNNFK